jgi:hypothetical protein
MCKSKCKIQEWKQKVKKTNCSLHKRGAYSAVNT